MLFLICLNSAYHEVDKPEDIYSPYTRRNSHMIERCKGVFGRDLFEKFWLPAKRNESWNCKALVFLFYFFSFALFFVQTYKTFLYFTTKYHSSYQLNYEFFFIVSNYRSPLFFILTLFPLFFLLESITIQRLYLSTTNLIASELHAVILKKHIYKTARIHLNLFNFSNSLKRLFI